MFVPDNPFQTSLMFGGKAEANPRVKHHILGWKGLPGTNCLAYYEKLKIMAGKSFITFATGCSMGLGISFAAFI